jgi:uncharacterized protein involved in response to NO
MSAETATPQSVTPSQASAPKGDNPALSRRRNYSGPALFSFGFRPFFLAAAVWAALAILLWLPQFFGDLELHSHLSPLQWHIHEMLFGYVAAAVAGFLLTAIPNWTGRLPVNGVPLAALAALWLAGRIVLLVSAGFGVAAAVIDVLFLVVLAAVAAREIIAGKNWRNLRVLLALGLLILGNIVFHAEVLIGGFADYGIRISIGAVILLITLIGGRIVPSFTNNWLNRNNPGRLPVAFSRYDAVTIAVSALALLGWVIAPGEQASGVLLILAGVMQTVRLARWAGDRTVSDRLLLILHIGYGFVPLGFLLLGAATWLRALPESAGIHAWMAGAVGVMTLAVMTRASLGHLKQPLVASGGTQTIYALVLVAALLRIAAAFGGGSVLLLLAGLIWVAAFSGFVVCYGPALIGRPPSWTITGQAKPARKAGTQSNA